MNARHVGLSQISQMAFEKQHVDLLRSPLDTGLILDLLQKEVAQAIQLLRLGGSYRQDFNKCHYVSSWL